LYDARSLLSIVLRIRYSVQRFADSNSLQIVRNLSRIRHRAFVVQSILARTSLE